MSLSFAIVKNFFKKYWKHLLISAVIVMITSYGIISYRNNQKMINALRGELDSARHDYDTAIELNRQEILRRQQLEQEYQKTIADLNEKYNTAIEQLDRAKQQRIRNIIVTTRDDPNEMAARINSALGIPLYNPNQR